MPDYNTPTAAPAHLCEFQWQLGQRLLVIDHGATGFIKGNLTPLLKRGVISAGVFDPLGLVGDAFDADALDNLQLIDDGLLAAGQPATLSHCRDAALSGSLAPLSAAQLPAGLHRAAEVIHRQAIDTMKLDDVDALAAIDWLILGGCHDHMAVLRQGERKLLHTLLFEVQLPICPTHQHQPNLAELYQWMADHGFQCLQLRNPMSTSHFPPDLVTERQQASQITTMEAIFTPSPERLANLTPQRLTQLAFLLDSIYQLHDTAYSLLSRVDSQLAHDYLAAKGFLNLYDGQADRFTLSADYAPPPWDETLHQTLVENLPKCDT